jgi:hypothetical protein
MPLNTHTNATPQGAEKESLIQALRNYLYNLWLALTNNVKRVPKGSVVLTQETYRSLNTERNNYLAELMERREDMDGLRRKLRSERLALAMLLPALDNLEQAWTRDVFPNSEGLCEAMDIARTQLARFSDVNRLSFNDLLYVMDNCVDKQELYDTVHDLLHKRGSDVRKNNQW